MSGREIMFCKNCGKQIEDNFKACPYCGTAVTSTNLEGGIGVLPPNTAPQQEKKSSKKFIILLGVAILVIAILVVVIIMMSNKMNDDSDDSKDKKSSQHALVSLDDPADDRKKPHAYVVEAETVTAPKVTEFNIETTTALVEVTEIVTDKSGGVVTTKPSGERVTEKTTSNKVEVVTEVVTQAETKKPQTKEEIVAYFNKVINDVKPGAKSISQIAVTNYLAGTATISQGIQGVYKMLGGDDWLNKMLRDNSQGAATYTGADIKAKFPVAGQSWSSKLSASDVSSATCTEKDGIYTITIKTVADSKSSSVQYGQGHNPKVFSVPLPAVVNENIPGAAKGMVGEASMAYPSSTITIKVSAKAGKVLSAEYDTHWTINFDKMGIVLPFATKSAYTINW